MSDGEGGGGGGDSHIKVMGTLVGNSNEIPKGDQGGCGSSLNRPLEEVQCG